MIMLSAVGNRIAKIRNVDQPAGPGNKTQTPCKWHTLQLATCQHLSNISIWSVWSVSHLVIKACDYFQQVLMIIVVWCLKWVAVDASASLTPRLDCGLGNLNIWMQSTRTLSRWHVDRETGQTVLEEVPWALRGQIPHFAHLPGF